ncbi:MAG: hypothetical protein AABZ02_06760 [Bacteroidota bacterium]
MDLLQLLHDSTDEILAAAEAAVGRTHLRATNRPEKSKRISG